MSSSQNEVLEAALTQHRAGHIDIAEPVYRRLLRESPNLHEAWYLLGIVELQKGNSVEAINNIEHAITLSPDNSDYFTNLGIALSNVKRNTEAIAAFERGHAINPNDVEPLCNIGIILYELQDFKKSEEYFRKALFVDPDHANANNYLGILIKRKGHRHKKEAQAYFEKSIATDPDFIPARMNMGLLAEEWGKIDTATAHFDRILALEPNHPVAFKRALLLPVVYQSTAEVDKYRQNLELALENFIGAPPQLSDPVKESFGPNFFLVYQGYNDRSLQEKLAKFYRIACPSLSYTAKHCQGSTRKPGRIRIGFVSKYLEHHTIGKLNRGLIQHLSRDEFEIFIFPIDPTYDSMAKEIFATANRVIPLVHGLDDARRVIAEQQLDILYFPDVGMESMTYFLGFARLAPVQCVTWGHPVTTGLETMDYFISSRAAETENAVSHYREKLIMFDRFSTYYFRPPKVSDAKRDDFGLPEGRNLYICPQTLFKLHPSMDEAFLGIAARDPDALIILIDMGNQTARTLLEKRWHTLSPDLATHITFVPRMSETLFMQLISLANVILDPFPFCGGNTSLEAFAQGVPTVTWPTNFLRGRLTAALYAQMGLNDGLADSLNDYVRRAVAIATEPDHRKSLSDAIACRSDKLFEDQAVIDEFSKFFLNVTCPALY